MGEQRFPCPPSLGEHCGRCHRCTPPPSPPPERVCPTQTPEVHLLGEFPMTCYRCHLEADS